MTDKIYASLCETNQYDQATQNCIEATVRELLNTSTTIQAPGLLFGKVQSGKTRVFIGIIAKAFDEGYNCVVVLTKGTKALAKQTYRRLLEKFDKFIKEDCVKVYDIMESPKLTPYMQKQKLIFIVKKETRNLDRVVELFEQDEEFRKKKVLIIDDEADYASVGFSKKKRQNEVEIAVKVLPKKIDNLRSCCARTDFLQVTATPYCLYLQPEKIEVGDEKYHPIRPAFTKIIPTHDGYIGSNFYFEESENSDSLASYLHIETPEKEFRVLGKQDKRYLNNILKTPDLKIFRFSILNFLVGGTIRRLSEKAENRKYKCSCIIHTETSREKHTWQYNLTKSFIENFKVTLKTDKALCENLTKESYENIKRSITIELPKFRDIFDLVEQSSLDGEIGISKINSEIEVVNLLDDSGQLRLDNPFNIFIGGNILDRGITVENLICFFYGRNPKKIQQDTVSQHSRMYGARSKSDIEVTRFYTSKNIHTAMKKINELETALISDLENGNSTIFLNTDESGKIRPCAPNKIGLSTLETIKAYKRLLPVGMQTVAKNTLNNINKEIDLILHKYQFPDDGKPILLRFEDTISILKLIRKSYEFSKNWKNVEYEWDVNIHTQIIETLFSMNKPSNEEKNRQVYCFLRFNRNTSRTKSTESSYPSFSNAPDDGKEDLPLAKEYADNLPVLQLFRQNGKTENGWLGTPFWWPVVVCPKNTKTMIYSK